MNLNKKKLSEICTAAVIAGGLAIHVAPAVAAGTAAGTLIKNLATVTYQDENGNEYSAQSNEAVITVKQVYSAEISEDTAKNASAGQTVYSSHILTNTGNGEDTFNITTETELTSSPTNGLTVYHDLNGNGLADPGEPMITEPGYTGSVTLAAGESIELVMAIGVPSTASEGDQISALVRAQAQEGTGTAIAGTVDDVTAGDGQDATEDTNHTVITVTNDAVLNVSKEAVLNEATNEITYTITVSNTGNQAATDVMIFDGLPAGMTYVSGSASGLLTTNGDTLPGASAATALDESGVTVGDLNADGDLTDTNEATLSLDLNSDGVVDATAVSGLYAIDSELPAGATISVTMVTAYDPQTFDNGGAAGSAGDVVKNAAFVTGDTDGDGNPDTPEPSNPTLTTLPQTYLISTSDTGVADPDADPATVNDGGDDDATNGTGTDDIQTVDSAPAGSTVNFLVDLTNEGTGPDALEIAIDRGDFPAGTTFTFWNESGTAQLTDTNSLGSVDTGLLDPNETLRIMVKAVLPAGADDSNSDPTADGYTATLTATSAGAPTTVPDTDRIDSTDLHVGEITSPKVDLREPALAASTADEDALTGNTATATATTLLGRPAYGAADGATIGGTVNIPFNIDNLSGSSDSFALSAGSSWDGTTAWDGTTMGPLPTGWTVEFYKADTSGNPTGSSLTNTELLPGMSEDNAYVAVVTIPADAANALADYGTMDFNADGDGDQPIYIRIESSNSGASDMILDAIDIESVRDITLTPPGTNQIQPGGSVDYAHSLENSGNTTETLELSGDNSGGTDGWNNTISVDTDGDGLPDTKLTDLVPGTDVIKGTDAFGNPIDIQVTDADGDGIPEITLPAGAKIDLTPTVFAPSTAAPGATDILTITATSVDPVSGADDTSTDSPSTSVEDVSSVLLGQVRLTKTAAYDQNCNGTPDAADGTDNAGSFEANLTAQVAPGECAIWQIQAENQGDADARNVVIHDEVPAFTTYQTGTLSYELGIGTGFTAPTDDVDGDTGEHDAGAITFYVGNADTDTVPGGTLVPGETATVRFSTMVD